MKIMNIITSHKKVIRFIVLVRRYCIVKVGNETFKVIN